MLWVLIGSVLKTRASDKHRNKSFHGNLREMIAICVTKVLTSVLLEIYTSRSGRIFENDFSCLSIKTYVVGTQKNRLNETVLLSTQNTC